MELSRLPDAKLPLVYAFAGLEWGREAGIELAERWVLTPLGGAAITGLALLAVALALVARASRGGRA